jgi:epoxyqueuosine reductase QueG
MIGYKNGDFNGTLKSQFGSDGLNSINADGKYDDFTFSGSFMNEKDATNIGIGWQGDNLSLKGNYRASHQKVHCQFTTWKVVTKMVILTVQ